MPGRRIRGSYSWGNLHGLLASPSLKAGNPLKHLDATTLFLITSPDWGLIPLHEQESYFCPGLKLASLTSLL